MTAGWSIQLEENCSDYCDYYEDDNMYMECCILELSPTLLTWRIVVGGGCGIPVEERVKVEVE